MVPIWCACVCADGFPIFGPFDFEGLPHTGLDDCGGKWLDTPGTVQGTAGFVGYAYFASPQWPYLLGCFGPGLGGGGGGTSGGTSGGGSGERGAAFGSGASSPLDHSFATREAAECPAGWFQRPRSPRPGSGDGGYGAGFGVGSSVVAGHSSGGCEPCPGGTFTGDAGGLLGGRALACGLTCPPGHFCPQGSATPAKCPASGARARACALTAATGPALRGTSALQGPRLRAPSSAVARTSSVPRAQGHAHWWTPGTTPSTP